MAGSSYPPLANPIAVVSPQFCAPYPVDLSIVRKVVTISEGNFVVTDVNGNVMFKVKGKFFSLRDRRVLIDAAGNPLLSFQQKIPTLPSIKLTNLGIMTAHRRWQIFRGDSSDTKDLLFTVKKSSMFQLKTKLDVFLASNTKEEACDFMIKGSWFERSCAIYLGESNNIIAQMHRKHTVGSVLMGKDNFSVTVYPNVDYAFIVALVVILEEINEDRNDTD